MDFDLSNRRAVVTGGSAGIGAATVRALANMGAVVEFCGRTESKVATTSSYVPTGSGSIKGHVADMSEKASITAS
jgi:3-oxoacyl-[acyl-carrier protein] reductase